MSHSIRRTTVAAALLLSASTLHAQTTVNFDSFSGMGNTPGVAVPAAAQLGTQLLGLGVRFSSFSDYVAVVTLGAGHATSGTMGIGGVTAAGTLSYGAPIRVTFWDPANSATQGVTTFVQIRGDRIPIAGTVTMKVFDPLGLLLATVTVPDAVGATLTYSGANVHLVEITGTSSTVAFDDLQFGEITAVPGGPVNPSVVPEPASIVLFGSGVLLLGVVSRRRTPIV